jgi:AAA+ ATPase superfamily predicted ATPase
MEFIGRKDESKIITDALKSDSFKAILLYGRRRVGKTELIRHCLKEAKGRIIPFLAAKTLYSTNFDSLVKTVARAYGLPLSFDNLGDLLSFIGEHAKKEKTVLVIDEYSYFRDQNGNIDSQFQAFIDEYQHESHLTLILSGSIVKIMKGLIEGDMPLYGRFSDVIPLAPFGYKEASAFYPSFSDEDKLFLYACFGGIPHYLLMLNPHESVEDNLIRLLFGANAALRGEADTLLNDEISAIDNANAVLSLIGSRSLHYKEINELYPSSSGNGATYILNKLLEMGLLKKSLSLDSKGEKNALYEIADPFLRFYFAFYVPTRSLSLLYSPKDLYNRFVKKDLEKSYLPLFFEEVARQYLIEKNRNGENETPFSAIGSYAFNFKDPEKKAWVNGQFDLVTKDDKGLTDYECKYESKPLDRHAVEEEERSVASSKIDFYRIGFFSKMGYSSDIKANDRYVFYTLHDIYKD